MSIGPEALAARWRDEATLLRRRGAAAQAETLESCAVELEACLRDYSLEALTLAQAGEESGFTVSALEKKLRRGEIKNAGAPGRPRIRRRDLPMKAGRAEGAAPPGGRPANTPGEPNLADRVLAARAARRHS